MSKLLLSTLVLAASTAAQSVFVPDNDPRVGTCNIIPFGTNTVSSTYSNQRYQQMVTVADFGSRQQATICDLGWASCVAGVRHFDAIEIRLGQTTAASLSTTFDANMVTNVHTVLKATDYDWHHGADSWDRIGLDRSYAWLAANGNLVVEIITEGAVLHSASTAFPGMRRDTRQRVYTLGWTGSPPATGISGNLAAKLEVAILMHDMAAFGAGCNGSNGVPTLSMTGTGQLGGTCNIKLANAPGSSSTLLSVGLHRSEPALDLAIVGARGCFFYHPNHLTVALATSATGTAILPINIPNDTRLHCARIYFQWFPQDATANRLGLTSSNYGRLLIGN